jgi:L-asparaginase II
MCGLNAGDIAAGTDGCSAPTFAMPLYNAALGFARLVDPETGQVGPDRRIAACRTITAAMLSHPDMVSGPLTFDTRLMQAAGGQVLSKGGAEGYLAMGLLPGATGSGSPALGIALKISDGDLAGHSRPQGSPYGHARQAVALEVLRQIGALDPASSESLAEFGPTFTVQNWRQLAVGEGRPVFQLERER